jgi:hypothetical protein
MSSSLEEPANPRRRIFGVQTILKLCLGAVAGGLIMIWFPILLPAGLGFVFLVVATLFSREEAKPVELQPTSISGSPETSRLDRGSLLVIRGVLGLCSGVFVGVVFTVVFSSFSPQVGMAGLFFVPLLVAVFQEPLTIGNPGGIPNTWGLVLGRLGIVAGLLLLEVVGCRVIEWTLPSSGSSDFRAAFGCLVFLSICIGLAAPLSAELASFFARRNQDIGRNARLESRPL